MKLEPQTATVLPFDFESLNRARKVRFIIAALRDYCREHEPKGDAAMLGVAKSLTIEGRQLVETMAHKLAKTKKPRAASETTWAQVIGELEAMADESDERAEGE